MSTSSPAVCPPSPPFSPFSLLPNELIQSIIESTVPHHFHSETYSARPSTLRSLCLVSKLFYELAKPLLYIVMEFRNGSSYDQWWGSSDATAKESVHDLSLKLDSLADSKIFDISSLVACCSNIATLVIWGADYEQVVDVGVLSQLKQLTVLRLSRLELRSNSSAVFPFLDELTLHCIQSPRPLSTMFHPVAFPLLRALIWYEFRGLTGNYVDTLTPLLPQLDALSVDAGYFRNLPRQFLLELSPKALFDLSPQSLGSGSIPLPHVRVLGDYETSNNLEAIVSSIRQTPLAALPSLLYLSTSYRAPFLDSRRGDDILDYAWDLKWTCEQRKIEVVFEEEPANWSVNSGMSEDFRRRMKERREKEG